MLVNSIMNDESSNTDMDKIKERNAKCRAYYEKNKEVLKAKARDRYNYKPAINSTEYVSAKEYYKQYYKKNRAKILLQACKSYHAHKTPCKKRNSVSAKRELIEKRLSDLLVKKQNFIAKLDEEKNNNVI